MKTKILALLTATLIFASCERENSSDVNQDRIYTTYILVYEEDLDVTYARAWFRFGSATGTLLELSSPSYAAFNNKDLAFKNALAYYEKNMAGKVESGTFFWEDYDGLQFENSIEIRDIAFPANFTELDNDAAFELSWDGEPLDDDEYVAILINGNLENDIAVATETAKGSTSITIPLSAVRDLLEESTATIWIERGYNPDLSQATGAGGEIYGKYRVSKEITVN